MERVFHNAKIGDIVYSLPAIYRRGGVKEYHIQEYYQFKDKNRITRNM